MENETEIQKCPQCESTNIMEDPRQGCVVCGDCGEIVESSYVLHTAPRIINDDPKTHGRVHHGESYNPYEVYSLTERSNLLTRDEKEFLWQGHTEINDALQTLFKTEVNHAVRDRAVELFNKSFEVQMKEKQAHLEESNNQAASVTKVSEHLAKKEKKPKKDEKEPDKKKRQRFSRKKQFVVTVLGVALTENIPKTIKKEGKEIRTPWSISEICKLVGSKEIKDTSIRRCLKDLDLDTDFFVPKKEIK